MRRQCFQKDWMFGKSENDMQSVMLPHDAMLVEGRNADASSGAGGAFFLGGFYIYEKRFWAPSEWKGEIQILEFEGVYPNARVFLNGREVGGCNYGYSNFYVTLTGIEYGKENCIRVLVDNRHTPNSRWYSGAGIYRPVWLWTGNVEHIVLDAVHVTTVDYKSGTIHIDVEATKEHLADGDVQIRIYDGGRIIVETYGCHTSIQIEKAKLWSDIEPCLYRLEVILKEGEQVLDIYETKFGIRELYYSDQGFFVNGEQVLLKGGCIHHDNGILGARSYEEAEWRRVKRMKKFGFNAIRSAHNPLCKAALEACDALGMYVMDEAWDMWDKSKNPHDYASYFAENYKFDLRQMIEKDYNHPCVIMYSIGNEVTEPAKPEGVILAEKLIAVVKKYDSTRPVTAGINLTLLMLASMGINLTVSNSDSENKNREEKKNMNSTEYNKMVSEQGKSLVMAATLPGADQVSSPVLKLLDICGYNYAVSRYEMEKDIHPERVIVGSETYAYELAKSWKLVEANSYIIGDFMWTAWDYLGEVGIGSWAYEQDGAGFEKKYPWLLADTGAFDILGNDNAEAGMAAVVWKSRKEPYIAVTPANHPGVIPVKAMWRGTNALPHWSYRNCDENEVEIQVYADAAEVEVLINEESVGRKKVIDYMAVFSTIYRKGNIKAVSYDENGKILAESGLQSADQQLEIMIKKENLPIENGQIMYLNIDIADSNGIVECNADERLTIKVEGGELLAFGSANPKTEESFMDGIYTTYYGRSQAVVYAKEDIIKIVVQGETLARKELLIEKS